MLGIGHKGLEGPGLQDRLLALEGLFAARTLRNAGFEQWWQAAGLLDQPQLPAGAVGVLQAGLLAQLLARLGVVDDTDRLVPSAARRPGSAFYRERLASHAEAVQKLAVACRATWKAAFAHPGAFGGSDMEVLASVRQCLAALPFTCGADIAAGYRRFLCASQDDIARIVTLATSGSTGAPKRLAFSMQDLARTRTFFAAGMGQIVFAGETLLVCLPGAEHPDGVADLLARGLEPHGVHVEALPSTSSDELFLETIAEKKPASLVLSPRQLKVLLAAYPGKEAGEVPPGLKSFLVSSDWCDPVLLRTAKDAWQVVAVDHYGITETGFGCALECPEQDGFHIRHLDVLCEIVDPVTGEVLPDGKVGELVLTTLRQEVMPLVRYRTGDAAFLRTDPCACSSPCSRLGQILGRFVPGTREIVHPVKAERQHLA